MIHPKMQKRRLQQTAVFDLNPLVLLSADRTQDDEDPDTDQSRGSYIGEQINLRLEEQKGPEDTQNRSRPISPTHVRQEPYQ